MKSEKEILNLFIKNRNELIDKLDSGDINKNEFLEKNYELIEKLSMRPFLKIDTVDKSIYNYQYYNILAKYHNIKANEFKNRDKKKYKLSVNKKNNYYYEKDRIILNILELINYSNISAYYINMHSSRLNDNIYEIVVNDYDKIVLHSMNKDILQKLKEKSIFDKVRKKSIIDSYINNGI